MGFFDFWKKKNNSNSGLEVCTTRSSMELEMNRDLFNQMTNDIATFMKAINITQIAELKFLKDDKGLLGGLVFSATASPSYTSIKRQDENQYLNIIGKHSFGYGIYVVGSQTKLGKPITEYTNDDVLYITTTRNYTDTYELGLNTLGISFESKNKIVFDRIIETAINSLKNHTERPLDNINIRTYMQVLFNAGVTILYRE
jgi:hypothetical protein